MGTEQRGLNENVQILSEAIGDIVDPLSLDEVRSLTIAAILEHRRRLSVSEDAYCEWVAKKDEPNGEADRLKAKYLGSKLANQAQMALVAALVDHLGFIPVVPTLDEEP